MQASHTLQVGEQNVEGCKVTLFRQIETAMGLQHGEALNRRAVRGAIGRISEGEKGGGGNEWILIMA